MTSTDQTAARPQRRVGTFTLGVVLVLAGTAMLVSLFYPALDLVWALKCAPCILIALGVETLLAARTGGRVKYDWLGMLLCFLLTGAALCMYAAAWWLLNGDSVQRVSRYTNQNSYQMSYQYFNGADAHTLFLEAGDVLLGEVNTYHGWLELEVWDSEGEDLCSAFPANGEQRIDIPRTGEYTIQIYGRRTSGSFSFNRVPVETSLEEALPTENEGAA